MEFLFDHIPIAVLIAGACILMRYPYIGAGLMLAVLCFEVHHYWLAGGCIIICIALHLTMGKHIRPRKGGIGPSRASQRAERKKEQGEQGGKR